MSLRIDRKKSIRNGRLVYKLNWEYALGKLFEICIYLGWTIMTIMILLNPKNAINFTATVIIISIDILLLISWYYVDKLLNIKISNPKRDRKIFVEILTAKFPELPINDNGVSMLRSKKSTSLFSWGKSITVFFEENNIFVNLTTLGRYETRSPLHSIFNYLKLKSVEREFNRAINGI